MAAEAQNAIAAMFMHCQRLYCDAVLQSELWLANESELKNKQTPFELNKQTHYINIDMDMDIGIGKAWVRVMSHES